MPLVSAVCPHCENTVQFQVTHVTRSRPCPHCGNVVMLQVAEKSNRVKRKALLMETHVASPDEMAAEKVSELPYEPQPLTGEAFDRMRMDPEIQRMRSRLIVGGLAVLALVSMAAVLHFTGILDKLTAKEEFEEKYGIVTKEASVDRGESFGFPGGEPKPEVVETPPPPSSGKLVFSGLDRGGQISSPQSSKGAEPFGDQRLVLKNFLEAPDLLQRLSWVANRGAVEEAMTEYYRKRGDRAADFDRLGKSSSAGPGATEHEVVSSSGEIRVATVLETPEGYRVDWPSFVAYGEMPWADFLAAKPTEPVLLRVKAAPGGHFENQFGDPSWFRCVNLTHVDDLTGGIVFGYVEKSSDVGREIEHWLSLSGGQPIPLTVRLKFPRDAFSDQQVWIDELVTAGWVTEPPAAELSRR